MSKQVKEIKKQFCDSYVINRKAISIDEPDKKGLIFGRVPFVLSTNAVDRHGEVVIPRGIQLKNYKKNPIVAWSHNALGGIFSNPSEDDIIGKIDINSFMQSDTELSADVLFNLTADENGELQDPRAKKIYDKLNAGVLNAGSIGFRSLERTEKDPIKGQTGVTHKKSDLIEFSIVPVGANPMALQKSLENVDSKTKELIYKELFENIDKDKLVDLYIKTDGGNTEGRQFLFQEDSEEEIINDPEKIEEKVNELIEHKAGRKISKKNETKLRNAKTAIEEVLNSLEKEEPKPEFNNPHEEEANNNKPKKKKTIKKKEKENIFTPDNVEIITLANRLGEDEIEIINLD